MENSDIIILKFLHERQDSLSYYQLSRKLKNKELHHEVDNLGKIIEELLQKKLIALDTNKISVAPFYELTKKGIELLAASENP
jgi:hypothetical protein